MRQKSPVRTADNDMLIKNKKAEQKFTKRSR